MRKAVSLAIGGGISLLALAMTVPGESIAQRGYAGTPSLTKSERSVGAFTPAVRDPRLAAELARRGQATGFRFTPATPSTVENANAVRVAVRLPATVSAPERARPVVPGVAPTVVTPAGTDITPSSYNLGAGVGWRRFALTGDVSGTSGGIGGSRERTRVGVEHRTTPRLTTRVQVESERAEGAQRIVSDDRAFALDVAGSYSITSNLAVTGGVRYRVSRDRIEPLARDERRDSQAVYVGTALRF